MPLDPPDHAAVLASFAASVTRCHPMIRVADMRASVAWYQAIGFTLVDQFEDDGELIYARVAFGACQLALSPGTTGRVQDASVWLLTNRVEPLYAAFQQRGTAFTEDLYVPFYGGRQFSVCDPDGLILIFWQPAWLET